MGRRELGLDGATVFGAIGRIYRLKNYLALIDAFGAAVGATSDACLVIVGPGDATALKAKTVALGIGLVIANVLLRTRLLRNVIEDSPTSFAILGDSSELRLDYASAYSWIPGRVHVEGLKIRGSDCGSATL